MNKDPTKELASMLANGWKVASMSIGNIEEREVEV